LKPAGVAKKKSLGGECAWGKKGDNSEKEERKPKMTPIRSRRMKTEKKKKRKTGI